MTVIDVMAQESVIDVVALITYLKNNLSAPGGVMSRREMLTYCVYAPLPRRPMPCQEP